MIDGRPTHDVQDACVRSAGRRSPDRDGERGALGRYPVLPMSLKQCD